AFCWTLQSFPTRRSSDLLAWFEQHGWATGKYGDAEVLSKAKGTSVGGLVDAGVVESTGGNLRLLKWAEMPRDWSPENDNRLPIWEDRKSTRLNSSHVKISYAVFCLKKKKKLVATRN